MNELKIYIHCELNALRTRTHRYVGSRPKRAQYTVFLGAETKEGFKKAPSIRERMVHPTPNGGAATNKLVDPKRELQKQCWSNTLKGDVTLYRDAKVKREKLLRKAQLKRERLAQVRKSHYPIGYSAFLLLAHDPNWQLLQSCCTETDVLPF